MDALLHLLRLLAALALIWSAVSVLVAAALSALLRAEQRSGGRWEAAERRRLWLEATTR